MTFKEQSDNADQQHDDLVQHFQAKDPGYDVASVDVVWTAQFAAQGWLQPLKDQFTIDTSAPMKPTVTAATYNNTLHTAPRPARCSSCATGPYVYSLASTDASAVVKNTFGVAALPGITGIGTSSPGGHSAGMSVYSQHKGTALDLMKFLESEEIQRFYVTQASNAPVTAKLYDDPDLKQC